VVRVPLHEASAKVRTGGPKDDPEDLDLQVWAGQVPLRMAPAPPVADEGQPPDIAVPGYLVDYTRPGALPVADTAPAT
jgi:hypothetical protein